MRPRSSQRGGGPSTLAQWASYTDVGPWCLLLANKDAFKASYQVMGPITVPVCLSTANLTAMSTIEAYSFVKFIPSGWDLDNDLLTRLGPLLMQVGWGMVRREARDDLIMTRMYYIWVI